MKKFQKIVMLVVFFGMLILGSVKSYSMDVEEGRHLFYREYRDDIRSIREEYGQFDLHNTDYGFVIVFQDEEESSYSMIEYDFEQEICTAWNWDFEKEVEEFDWKGMLLEKAYELD